MRDDKVLKYLDRLNEVQRKYTQEFIDYLKKQYPNLTPKISFAMPMWLIGEKMTDGYIGMSVAKEHYSIHFGDEKYIEKLQLILPNCNYGKRCIKIKYDDKNLESIIKKAISDYIDVLIG